VLTSFWPAMDLHSIHTSNLGLNTAHRYYENDITQTADS